MICPNCGREISDSVIRCPGCSARIHGFRRRSEVNLPEQPEIRVRRRLQPVPARTRADNEVAADYSEARADAARVRSMQGKKSGAREKTERKARLETPDEAAKRQIEARRHQMPVELQHARDKNNELRYVRRPERPVKKKVDAKPAVSNPPLVRKSHKRLLFAVRIILLILFFILAYGSYMLFFTEDGQRLMAEWGWSVARTDAYITLGKQLMEASYDERAAEVLEIALEREPRNVDALLYLAQVYTKLNREDDAVKIYESLIHDIAPQHPSAYRALIGIYQKRGYHSEALDLMKLASQQTLESSQEFDIMLRSYTPRPPMFSHPEGRYNEEIDVTISIPEGEIVYYTTDGTDPSESGQIYTAGTKIHLKEGKLTVKAIGFTENGMPSEQIVANYTVIIPTPAAPKSNYASGTYKNAPKVSLRPGDEDEKKNRQIVAIYYTLDGRQATPESTLYNPDEPIQLPVGDSVLRAVSVDKNGKVSYEMKVTYKVQGNLKRMFNSDNDSFKNMTLYKTTYSTFTRAWGAPLSYETLPEDRWYDAKMETFEAVYDWGTAWFAAKTDTKNPVLVRLDTSNGRMTAPRSTSVGMSASQIMEKFRDLGHPALDEYGNRLLYNWNSAGVQFGTYRREADGTYVIHYYDPVDEKQTIFVELSYYLDEDMGTVNRIVWRRYEAGRL